MTDELLRTDLADPAKGAGLVAFQQAGSGAIARTLLDKARERVTPEDFGAIGDGVADDIFAFQKAVAYLATRPTGGTLYIPARTYYLSEMLVIANSSITIAGEDRHNSRILWGADALSGFSFTFSAPGGGPDYVGVNVSNLTLLTLNSTIAGGYSSPTKTAIYVNPSNVSQGSPYPSVSIDQVNLRGQSGFSHFWNCGIYLNNCNNVIITNSSINGHFNTQDMWCGIFSAGYSINCSVVNCNVNYGTYGVLQYSNVTSLAPGAGVPGAEGLQLIGVQMGGLKFGAVKDNGMNAEARPLILVQGCHINAAFNCVKSSNVSECVIVGNLFYIQDTVNNVVESGARCVSLDSPTSNVGVNAPRRHVISGNIFRSLTGQVAVRGITCNVQNVSISGCVFDQFDFGMILQSLSANVNVSGCTFSNISQFHVQNSGAGNSYVPKQSMSIGSSFNV
ncbi:glycosyl hydrolase family 28-related protein [Xanthomonas tesorieronis]|uniref:glycosyl hydrolase family 28-related protein n=1 Tax=Xanthomonas tesorieronis TaxID=3160839 RepID=UPI003512ABFC